MNVMSRGPLPRSADPWVRTHEPLIWLGGAGHERRGPEYFFDCRRRPDRPHMVIQFTLSGCGFYERPGMGRILLPRGLAFIDVIPGNFRYGYAAESRGPYELLYVAMAGAIARRWHQRIVQGFGHVLRFDPEGLVAAQMRALARQRAEAAPGDRYLMSGRLHQLLMSVMSALTRSRIEPSSLTARALAHIVERAASPGFQIQQLAAALNCSREHLSRQFRPAMGVSPSDYLIQHRLRLAAREIRGGNDKLETIAHRCGFAGANYLCRAFRQRYGITPGQYRARPDVSFI